MKTRITGMLLIALFVNALLLGQQPDKDRLKDLVSKFPTPANLFTIAKTGTGASVTRTCTTTSKGACPGNGKW